MRGGSGVGMLMVARYVLGRYPEGATCPVFYYWKDGLKEEKV